MIQRSSMTGVAILSDCEQYRYVLRRFLPNSGPSCLFVMLNPSTADAQQDDPTIRRCLAFAREWNCSSMTVINLFALRATNPKYLLSHPDPFGPLNMMHCKAQLSISDIIVAAWGAHPMALKSRLHRHNDNLWRHKIHCLGRTKNGQPRHPLYLRKDASLELFHSRVMHQMTRIGTGSND